MKKRTGDGSREGSTPEVASSRSVLIDVNDRQRVSGLLREGEGARACYVLAHGAGAGMRQPFLEDMAKRFATNQVTTLRYQFPYMEQGTKRPDGPKVAQSTVRAASIEAARVVPELALFAGGKSFGGRMTSQAQAESPLPAVRGLIFLGFPLHPPGRPSNQRGEHLFAVRIPMLFVQGDRDEFADLHLLQHLIGQLGGRTTLKLFEDADHSFHVPARTGRKDSDVRAQIVEVVKDWVGTVLGSGPPVT